MRPAAFLILFQALTTALHAQALDSAGVRRAALDYVEGFYEGDSTRHLRSVSPDVVKYGYWRTREGAYQGGGMTWSEFHEFTGNVRRTGRTAPFSAPKVVELLDLLDQTAAVKVTAWWGTDYLLLAREGGAWKIRQVLWQSAMPGRQPVMAPTPVPADGLRRMHWILGRWRGSGGRFAAFYEEYAMVGDSVLRQYAFADSTFRMVTDSSRFTLHNGRLVQRRGEHVSPAIQFTGDSVRFLGRDGGNFLWTRTGEGRWRAVLEPPGQGRDRTVYEMVRIR